MSITGEQDGAPMKVGVAVVDLMTGTNTYPPVPHSNFLTKTST